MAQPIPITVAFFHDGEWQYQSMQLIATLFVVRMPESDFSEERIVSGRKAKRSPHPPPLPSSHALAELLEGLCASTLNGCKTLPVQRNLVLRLVRIPSLSSCHVDTDTGDERFGKLAHWCDLVASTGFSNIVVYFCAERDFFVVSLKQRNTQRVSTRSAISWLRDAAGLGFCCDDEHGIFRIQVSRSLIDQNDPWAETLAQLICSVPSVFPSSTFDDEN